MSGKVKPLTKAEWERGPVPVIPTGERLSRINVTINALFAYRERTRGMQFPYVQAPGAKGPSDEIAAELGIE